MEKAIFGIIGVGGIAQSQHLPNLTRAPHVHLKTACDLDEALLSSMADKYKIPNTTTDYTEMLADPEIQAVVVATHEDTQGPLSIAAVQAGKNVYVEKPLAKTADECKAVADAAAKAGKFVAVGFNRRFAPAYQLAKKIITEKGGARNIHYRVTDNYTFAWGRNFPPGYRVIVEICHIFDLLRFLTDSEAASVYCIDSRDDDEAIAIKFTNGCVATIMGSGYTTLDLPKERLEVVTEQHGGIIVDQYAELRTFGYEDYQPVYTFPGHTHPDNSYLQKYLFEKQGSQAVYDICKMGWELRNRYNDPADADKPDHDELVAFLSGKGPHLSYMFDKGWLWAIDHFAESIINKTRPENSTAYDAFKASEIGNAAIESRSTGQPVFLGGD